MATNCQHCNDELENKRAKNCDACSGLLNIANKKQVYSFVLEASAQANRDGLRGEDVRNMMEAAIEHGKENQEIWLRDYRAQQQERAQRESARIAEYRKNGATIFVAEDSRNDIEELEKFNNRTNVITPAESETFG